MVATARPFASFMAVATNTERGAALSVWYRFYRFVLPGTGQSAYTRIIARRTLGEFMEVIVGWASGQAQQ
jgi:hypothetical protein